jgi:heptosyltransferase-1
MGDIIHTLPAISDVAQHLPELSIDWLVEEHYAVIAKWHPKVQRVIPVALRRWRKNWWQAWRQGELGDFWRALRHQRYDYIIDAQGLVKSALLTSLVRGEKYGYDKHSIREPRACFAYHHQFAISRQQHAITRIRQLFAHSLGYTMPNTLPDYQLSTQRFPSTQTDKPYLIFLPGTTWESKLWPAPYWQQLAALVTAAGFQIRINWNGEEERQRGLFIQNNNPQISLIENGAIDYLAQQVVGSIAAVTVDTGPGHLAVALGVPTVFLFGPTDPKLVGAFGGIHDNITQTALACAPCLKRKCFNQDAVTSVNNLLQPPCLRDVTPELVWERLQKLLKNQQSA